MPNGFWLVTGTFQMTSSSIFPSSSINFSHRTWMAWGIHLQYMA